MATLLRRELLECGGSAIAFDALPAPRVEREGRAPEARRRVVMCRAYGAREGFFVWLPNPYGLG